MQPLENSADALVMSKLMISRGMMLRDRCLTTTLEHHIEQEEMQLDKLRATYIKAVQQGNETAATLTQIRRAEERLTALWQEVLACDYADCAVIQHQNHTAACAPFSAAPDSPLESSSSVRKRPASECGSGVCRKRRARSTNR
eukprot:Blabericola_migrator_1__7426@NODE_3786_length_1510_cov_55_525988_g2349_i0_p2_GENE_NODE_3786_length_1510_cov_55_525988_g2349_i0NODE_3786_length_1510_cov_55_525988_g2349_i0_p2_ORF_typecomplete_len143_score13_30PIEZO/PF15917_5/0_04Trns_repr_metal/PF02583_17/1_6e03Trns_repr_metal/PF02583_17/0_24_NODE_3786_length_1510_cov_55_525988_g2349_i010351463